MILSHLIYLLTIMYLQDIPTNLVIAHRGVPYFAPEETAPAYILARELGADYLEADLQRTSDGVIVALHDNTLSRTTNIKDVFPERAQDPASSFTWAELQQLDAGSWFNKRYPNRARPTFVDSKILSLEQLLDIAEQGSHHPGVYLETKHPDHFPGIEKELQLLLEQRNWYNKKFSDGRPKVILQTFSPESLKLLHQYFPKTPICWLMWAGDACLKKVDESHFQECLEFAKTNGATIIGPSFKGEASNYYDLMQPWMIDMAHGQGFQIHPYTFNTSGDNVKYAPLSEGQFTNRTDLLLDYYGRQHLDIETILVKFNY